MTVTEIKKKIEKMANEIDKYLDELEKKHQDQSKKYQTLLYIASALQELEEIELD